MNYSAAVKETWRHHGLENAAHDYVRLVRYGTLAASSHNTQPWKFKLEPSRVIILPDMSRRCPAVDPDDHHLYASLGCAAENLLLAAQTAGLWGDQSYEASTSGVHIHFDMARPSSSTLYEAIVRRQCVRADYDGRPLARDERRLIEHAGRGNGVSVMLLTEKSQKEQVAQYVAEGNTAQFGDAAWRDELESWIRFNARDAMRTGDGLYGPVMGSPDVPPWLGRLYLRVVSSAKKQNRKDIRHIRSSSAIAVLFSERDDIPHWIEAGRCYERLALQATALGLCTAFINQPVEVPALRPQLAGFLGIGPRRPDLIVRIGHGPEMPRSLRRPVEHVLV